MRYMLPLLAALSLVLVGACATPEETTQTTAAAGAAATPAPPKKAEKKLPPAGDPFTVYFKFDSTDLTEKSHGEIFDILQKVPRYKPKSVKVVAHADKPGTDEYNMNLSQERADALAKMLTGAGAAKVDATGVGETQPIVDTEMRNQANRRAVINFE